ncbi:hypothetical protein LX15_005938 [Streptoalloteichus tenebrarius]|uniref:Uncharacterized protein n=1 Tax=Streptoalloteichus tenebrarius (strain ATCC 17920 / DSM 40477 / JCM 4838 / CBS 697.72 / NBRC 16177 / NCIMB 11028 / NRRL B-12390 / A12253. 1 / ISP 5477) TaxID=1933 RepID=A0ABT1I364_STRSD|nr:hypothetical protein [Streptoalloteichus tenebrarius]MCP2262204.1 hypothetical protein [Streptoalloteichus tenebrarius]BFE98957.1 hypothetical protein GCM10020241_06330 [Streptoalloteichus tenebrarius]
MRISAPLARVGAVLSAVAALVLGGLAPTAQAANGWTTYTVNAPNATYYGIYASGSEAWIVGTVNPYPTDSTVLQHFDGRSWSPITAPNVGDARAITGTSASDLWIGGSADAVNATAHFDGQQWTTYPVPDQWNVVQMLAVAPNNAWAVTQTPANSPVYHGQRLIHFDGSSWTVVTPPQVAGYTEPDIHLSGSGAGDVWVNYSDRDGRENTLLRASGTSFTAIPSPGYGASIVPLSDTDAWASGPAIADSGNGELKSNPLHWDGRSWKPVDDGQKWTSYQPRVAAGGTVWANRTEYFSGYGSVTLVRWSGGRWQTVPGISGLGHDGVFQYAAATPRSAPWALFAQGRDKNRQNIKLYTG